MTRVYYAWLINRQFIYNKFEFKASQTNPDKNSPEIRTTSYMIYTKFI